MNIHNGGSEFIWLSMSFGTVKYKKSSLGYVPVQKNIDEHTAVPINNVSRSAARE